MSVWGGIKSIFSSSEIVNHVANGVDKTFYTKEEQADTYQSLLKLYEPFRMAQRLLSVGMFVILSLALFTAAIIRVTGSIWCDPVLITDLATDTVIQYRWWVEDSTWLLNQAIALFGEPFLYVSVFYFGGGAFEGIARGMAERRDNVRKGKAIQSDD